GSRTRTSIAAFTSFLGITIVTSDFAQEGPAVTSQLPQKAPGGPPSAMALLFSGAVTSSPIKEGHSLAEQSCHSKSRTCAVTCVCGSRSLGLSPLSPELTYQCYSLNPLTGSLCSCRRSPRLLSNGYYVLTEDSYACDGDGNVSLTPSKTNVSYKENPVR
ncbi:hypothetical protein Z043_121199, partial [Scleropages formosus]